MKRRHSLSIRLLLLFIVTAVLIALTIRSGFRYGIQDELRSLAAPHLLEYIEHLQQVIGDPPDYASAQQLAHRLSLEIHAMGPEDSWSTSGKLPDLSAYRFHQHRTSEGTTIEVGHNEHRLAIKLSQGEYTLLLIPKRLLQSRRVPLALILSIFVVISLIALAYYLVRRLFRPIATIRDGINRFGTGQLDHRIHIGRLDELGELAKSINTMADDIQQMLEAKRQLLLAISHELRSPLTRARVNTELLQDSSYKQSIISDLNAMEYQVTELLETERLDNRHAKLDLSVTSPSRLLKQVIEQYFSINDFELHDEQTDLYLSLDPMRMRLLLKNLLDNALRHTPEDVPAPLINNRLDSNNWVFTVTDRGPGIAAEHLPHLTEPFYRVDKSRQRDTGGYGLGLYLCRVIAEAHGGRLDIKSTQGKGTEVTFTLPLP